MRIQENVPLAPYTTLRIGGSARYFVEVETETDLREAHHFALASNLPVFALGGGSNLLVADAGFRGLVLHLALQPSIVEDWREGEVEFHVSAGTPWDDVVRRTCDLELSGMECLAGIPGLVGASPIQNIGAYGQEVSGSIASVRAFDRSTESFTDLTAQDCRFAYRTSIFNTVDRNRYFICSVRFRLLRATRPDVTYADLKKHFAGAGELQPGQVAKAVRAIRAGKGMYLDPACENEPDTRSAGSFFKNPVVPLAAVMQVATRLRIGVEQVPHWPVAEHPEAADPGGTVPGGTAPGRTVPGGVGRTKLPAAWLIERAGFPKGYRLGPVGISSRHTLALTNYTGTAACADLLALRDQIVAKVREDFGVMLEQEPVYLS